MEPIPAILAVRVNCGSWASVKVAVTDFSLSIVMVAGLDKLVKSPLQPLNS